MQPDLAPEVYLKDILIALGSAVWNGPFDQASKARNRVIIYFDRGVEFTNHGHVRIMERLNQNFVPILEMVMNRRGRHTGLIGDIRDSSRPYAATRD